jgi:hypothetical protein
VSTIRSSPDTLPSPLKELANASMSTRIAVTTWLPDIPGLRSVSKVGDILSEFQTLNSTRPSKFNEPLGTSAVKVTLSACATGPEKEQQSIITATNTTRFASRRIIGRTS